MCGNHSSSKVSHLQQQQGSIAYLGVVQNWLAFLLLSILKLEAREALLQDSNDCAVGHSVCVGDKIPLAIGFGSDSSLNMSLCNVSHIHNKGEGEPI